MRYVLDTDPISFLQRRSGSEFNRLTMRMARHAIADFALSVISFHEQVLGAHSYINRARTNADIVRGYTLLLETLQGYTYDIKSISIYAATKERLSNSGTVSPCSIWSAMTGNARAWTFAIASDSVCP